MITPRIAAHTLGCKVNQYDTQAMVEIFEGADYQIAPFESEADVYLINTCTVTGTGDRKSMQLIRRVGRERPNASIIVAGCLAQREAARLLALPGIRLVIGTQRRGEVYDLFTQAIREGRAISAVDNFKDAPFERLSVARHEGRTRAVMKIQEGCDRHCSYCVVPSVRGPVRSLPLPELRTEAERLAQSRFLEIVLTGIHLTSYGRERGEVLLDAIRAVHSVEGIERIRLGSLEPLIADDAFVDMITQLPKVCRQFHLALQSGSDTVLKRMNRRYTRAQFAEAVARVRTAMPDAAVTTDILTGFPGETEREAEETFRFVEEMRFSRIHVFPFSKRTGTVAAGLPGQLSAEIKRERATQLINLGNKLEREYAKEWIGHEVDVLFEEETERGAEGYTGQYVRVAADGTPGVIQRVRIERTAGALAIGTVNRFGKG